jgi:putative SOS response-associated peptidase YedK
MHTTLTHMVHHVNANPAIYVGHALWSRVIPSSERMRAAKMLLGLCGPLLTFGSDVLAYYHAPQGSQVSRHMASGHRLIQTINATTAQFATLNTRCQNDPRHLWMRRAISRGANFETPEEAQMSRRLAILDMPGARLIMMSLLTAIFPKGAAPIVALDDGGNRVLRTTHWGFVLPQTSKKTGKPIQPKAVNNARDDKLRRSPIWKASFTERRCLIPASSFCESKGRNPATYVWFGVTGDTPRPPFAHAGIWRSFAGNYGTEYREFTTSSMITTTPNELVKDTDPDRMPAILDPDDYDTWLTAPAEDAFRLLRPYPADKMVIHQQGENMKSDHGGL